MQRKLCENTVLELMDSCTIEAKEVENASTVAVQLLNILHTHIQPKTVFVPSTRFASIEWVWVNEFQSLICYELYKKFIDVNRKFLDNICLRIPQNEYDLINRLARTKSTVAYYLLIRQFIIQAKNFLDILAIKKLLTTLHQEKTTPRDIIPLFEKIISFLNHPKIILLEKIRDKAEENVFSFLSSYVDAFPVSAVEIDIAREQIRHYHVTISHYQNILSGLQAQLFTSKEKLTDVQQHMNHLEEKLSEVNFDEDSDEKIKSINEALSAEQKNYEFDSKQMSLVQTRIKKSIADLTTSKKGLVKNQKISVDYGIKEVFSTIQDRLHPYNYFQKCDEGFAEHPPSLEVLVSTMRREILADPEISANLALTLEEFYRDDQMTYLSSTSLGLFCKPLISLTASYLEFSTLRLKNPS